MLWLPCMNYFTLNKNWRKKINSLPTWKILSRRTANKQFFIDAVVFLQIFSPESLGLGLAKLQNSESQTSKHESSYVKCRNFLWICCIPGCTDFKIVSPLPNLWVQEAGLAGKKIHCWWPRKNRTAFHVKENLNSSSITFVATGYGQSTMLSITCLPRLHIHVHVRMSASFLLKVGSLPWGFWLPLPVK